MIRVYDNNYILAWIYIIVKYAGASFFKAKIPWRGFFLFLYV